MNIDLSQIKKIKTEAKVKLFSEIASITLPKYSKFDYFPRLW